MLIHGRKKILVIIGTRPEVIKVAPLFFKREKAKHLEFILYTTGQHIELLEEMLPFFQLTPFCADKVMIPDQSLEELTARLLQVIAGRIKEIRPDYVLVQGDTTTAFCGALSAFYQQVPVIHLEAGLRSYVLHNPFPEELNRTLIGRMADIHLAPSEKAMENLAKEGITKNVYNVGNTVIDALEYIRTTSYYEESYRKLLAQKLPLNQPFVLVTGHRRENFGPPMQAVFSAFNHIAEAGYPVIFPVHLNPHVQAEAKKILRNKENIYLLPPVDYPSLAVLLSFCSLVITDSGGIQEEASYLGKPLIITRTTTERPEVITHGGGILAGTNEAMIVNSALRILRSHTEAIHTKKNTLYGKGDAAERIYTVLLNHE